MKKVSGTLKLDQAQYRELEAFSKFGSDLDPATKAVLDKGRKNVELLKQPQYSPVNVAHQVALIYCGTQGLLGDVPADKVKEFEKIFIDDLQIRYNEVLENLGKGNITDKETDVLKNVAKDVARRFVVEE